jgi:hypothetical protein
MIALVDRTIHHLTYDALSVVAEPYRLRGCRQYSLLSRGNPAPVL